MKRPNLIRDKSMRFAISIIKVCQQLQKENEFVLSKQLLRSSTSVGASVREAEYAESKKDFIHKMAIALKEANESEYWLELLLKSEYIKQDHFNKLDHRIKELLRLLISIIKTAKRNLCNEQITMYNGNNPDKRGLAIICNLK